MYITAVIISSPDEIEDTTDIVDTINNFEHGAIGGRIVIKFSRKEKEFSEGMKNMLLEKGSFE